MKRVRPAHLRHKPRRRAKITIAVATVAGGAGIAAVSFATSLWTVNLNGGSSGEAQANTPSNLTISAAYTSGITQLYPGSTGDVVVSINNPNSYPVTISGFSAPSSTTYAVGYTDSALSSANTNCTGTGANASYVTWNGSGAITLPSPVVIATGTTQLTLTGAAAMGTSSPNGCESSYFQMPALSGITATVGGGSPVSSGASVSW